jgi:hypothetical protein
MTKDEALKLALEALEDARTNDDSCEMWDRNKAAITAIKEALAQPAQEPVVERAWFTIAELNAWADKKLADNPQWVMPTEEPERKEALAQPVQATSGWSLRYVYFDEDGIPLMYREPEERNFCPRCGKRTADLTTIHTCTPPEKNA